MINRVAPEAVLRQLGTWVAGGHRIMIGGDAGVGKTTLLIALASAVPHEERIIKIEDSGEIWLVHPNVASLEARAADDFGSLHRGDDETGCRTSFSVADAVDDAMRMAGARLIVGELRDGKAALALMMSGHASITTFRAGSPGDAFEQLDGMLRRDTGTGIDMVLELLHQEGPYLYVQMGWPMDTDTRRHAILGVYELVDITCVDRDDAAQTVRHRDSDLGFLPLWSIEEPDVPGRALVRDRLLDALGESWGDGSD